MNVDKQCGQCRRSFEVTSDDLAFYAKISPTFNGQRFEIPTPTFCPDCRQQHRIAFRNERSLHSRKCDLCLKSIISVYSPDAAFPVYCQECWWSDKWDDLHSGRDFDSSLSVFQQLKILEASSPHQALNVVKSENCNYSNFSSESKNCYLCFSVGLSEDCLYGKVILSSKNCVDCFAINGCEYCYECVDCQSCYRGRYLTNCQNCSDSQFLYDCSGCDNCFMSWNLRNKQYQIQNVQYSKEEYFERLREYDLHSRLAVEEYTAQFRELVTKNAIFKYAHGSHFENSTGDYLNNCKNCWESFDLLDVEDSKYLYDAPSNIKDCHDSSYLFLDSERCYQVMSSTRNYQTLFCSSSRYGTNIYYCNLCENCKDCFGCVGLKGKQYCIFNKQYSKEEYEKRVAEIIQVMIQRKEWGEFFPLHLSGFGYNETVANEYYPLVRGEALKIGSRWTDEAVQTEKTGTFLVPEDDIRVYANTNEVQLLLNGVIRCEVSDKPFKILPQEIAFYIEQGIPVPTKHFETRHLERFKRRNPRMLYHRSCMREGCSNEFETSYAPDRPEIVYCEDCYQKEVL